MSDGTHADRPAEMVAASDRPIELVGHPASMEMIVPPSTESRLEDAAALAQTRDRLFLNVEDLEAERNPAVIYGVYFHPRGLDISSDPDPYHVGNIAPFGIEHGRDPDAQHRGAPGFRHTFDVTSHVRQLVEAGEWDPAAMTVTFQVIPPLPPPDSDVAEADIATSERDAAAATPLRIGRVSLFVG